MKAILLLCSVLLASSTALALDLSGEWTSQITFASGVVSPSTTLTLHLAGSGWQLTSAWDPALLDVSRHSLVLRSSLGPVGVTAGASFRLATRTGLARVGAPDALALWTTDGFSFRGGFVSFELALGNVTLRLTLISGAEE
jgi:hypothetical protein